jgi:energy-coupling factor transporter ATP-binding protein EcfA2
MTQAHPCPSTLKERNLIELDGLSFRYPDGTSPVLHNVNLIFRAGGFILVTGPSGSGKSTLLRTLNGLVPHFSGGHVSGRVRVAGHDPIAEGPRAMSRIVGFVQQDPESQFVVDTVEDELAFALENQALPQSIMQERVEWALAQVGLAALRQRRIHQLSAGQKQRVAIASVLTVLPQVLVLDEPTSQLDPLAADEVLTTLRKLNREQGLTVILSEHRLERVAAFADLLVFLPGARQQPLCGRPADLLLEMPFAPPLAEMSRRLGWRPVPLTVEEARPFAQGLELGQSRVGERQSSSPRTGIITSTTASHPPVVQVRDLWYDYDGIQALRGVDLQAHAGESIALAGNNGSGKTTLLKHLVGLLCPKQGQVLVHGLNTRTASVEELIRYVGYVPQDPSSLLFSDTVAEELAFTRRAHRLPAEDPAPWLERLGLAGMGHRYPRQLSVGERQRVALAAILVAEPTLLLLDEPTRGLDPIEKQALAVFLKAQSAMGRTVLLATHDVELAAQCAQRVVLLDGGRVVADGPTGEVMSQWPAFGSQVNRLFQDPRLLTVRDVWEALGDAS